MCLCSVRASCGWSAQGYKGCRTGYLLSQVQGFRVDYLERGGKTVKRDTKEVPCNCTLNPKGQPLFGCRECMGRGYVRQPTNSPRDEVKFTVEFPSGVWVGVTQVCLQLDVRCPNRGWRTLVQVMGVKSDTPDYGRVVVWLEFLPERRNDTHHGWCYTSGDFIADMLRRAEDVFPHEARRYCLKPVTELPAMDVQHPWFRR